MASIKGLTESEAEFLSDEERAALQESGDDMTPGVEVKNAEEAEKANRDADAGGGAVEGSDDAGDDKTGTAGGAADAAAAGNAKDEGAAAPAPNHDLPALPAAEKKDWNKLESEIVEKYEGGELTEQEYRKAIRDLVVDQTRAEVTETVSAQFTAANWERDQRRFFDENRQFKDNPGLYAALDSHIARLDRETKGGLTGYELLSKAKEAFNVELTGAGITTKADSKADSRVRPKPPSEAEAIAAATGRAPATLAHLPAAADEGVGDSKFSHLDKLDGMELESALARMSEADRESYLSGA